MVATATLAFIFVFLTYRSSDQTGLARYQEDRLALSRGISEWSRDFVERQEEMRDWLSRRGTSFEVEAFEGVSRALMQSARAVASERSDGTLFNRLLISLHFAVMRIAFVIVAVWRLWIVGIIAALCLSYFRFRAYEKDDLLGQTGNGRLFYSGIRAGLNNVDEHGRPRDQIVGLACPKKVGHAEFAKSELASLLKSYGALNATTEQLSSILLAYESVPAFVTSRADAKRLEECYVGSSLPEHARLVLKAALNLHEELRQETAGGSSSAEQSGAARHELLAAEAPSKLGAQAYADLLAVQFRRVLTEALKIGLAALTPAEVATIILAHESGKVMAYAFEGGRWNKKSQFPQLGARSVLHAIASFSKEFDFDSRSDIRRALIYASRHSVFAPVLFPIDLSVECRAIRQWTELLSVLPYELPAVADEVELLGLVYESYQSWQDNFFKSLVASRADIVDGCFASQSNVLFMPLQNLLRALRSVIAPERLRRIEVLTALVSQKQRMGELSRDMNDENTDRRHLYSHQKVFAPFNVEAMKELAAIHEVPLQDIRDWSALRVVLNAHSWLARRVGDYTVGETSLILVVMKPMEGGADCNSFGLLGRPGMVPLRATRLAEQWGKSWGNRFRMVSKATMAETRERYQKLLSGQDDETPAEDALEATGIG